MTDEDKTLLEMAAKAAGLKNYRYRPAEDGLRERIEYDDEDGCTVVWMPHLNDGDVLRLAVMLRISLDLDYVSGSAYPAVCATLPRELQKRVPPRRTYVIQQYFVAADGLLDKEDDVVKGLDAAVRRAIVRAVAEIGKAMQ